MPIGCWRLVILAVPSVVRLTGSATLAGRDSLKHREFCRDHPGCAGRPALRGPPCRRLQRGVQRATRGGGQLGAALQSHRPEVQRRAPRPLLADAPSRSADTRACGRLLHRRGQAVRSVQRARHPTRGRGRGIRGHRLVRPLWRRGGCFPARAQRGVVSRRLWRPRMPVAAGSGDPCRRRCRAHGLVARSARPRMAGRSAGGARGLRRPFAAHVHTRPAGPPVAGAVRCIGLAGRPERSSGRGGTEGDPRGSDALLAPVGTGGGGRAIAGRLRGTLQSPRRKAAYRICRRLAHANRRSPAAGRTPQRLRHSTGAGLPLRQRIRRGLSTSPRDIPWTLPVHPRADRPAKLGPQARAVCMRLPAVPVRPRHVAERR